MLQDIWTVCWKEWREYLVGQGGGRFGNLRVLALIVIAAAFVGHIANCVAGERRVFPAGADADHGCRQFCR